MPINHPLTQCFPSGWKVSMHFTLTWVFIRPRKATIYRFRAPPVYQRQHHREDVNTDNYKSIGNTLFETDAVSMWHEGDNIAIISIKIKLHAIDEAMRYGLIEAIQWTEQDYSGLKLWSPEPYFCAGANIKQDNDPLLRIL